MTPVDQEVVCKERGDCQRAAIASLLDFELSMVPHFRLFSNESWMDVYLGFMRGCGFDYEGNCSPKADRGLQEEDAINGHFYASVPSKTFPETSSHGVLIGMDGTVTHDPNPNKLWQGEQVVSNNVCHYWHMWSKVEK